MLQEERDWVAGFFDPEVPFWIGLRRDDNGVWGWSDSTPVDFQYWDVFDSRIADSNCTLDNHEGLGWHNALCNLFAGPYVCKSPTGVAISTPVDAPPPSASLLPDLPASPVPSPAVSPVISPALSLVSIQPTLLYRVAATHLVTPAHSPDYTRGGTVAVIPSADLPPDTQFPTPFPTIQSTIHPTTPLMPTGSQSPIVEVACHVCAALSSPVDKSTWALLISFAVVYA